MCFPGAEPGVAPPPDAEVVSQYSDPTPGGLAAYGTPLLAGRDFDDRDTDAAPRLVVRLVLLRVSILVGLGLVAGAAISLWASAFVAPLVYGLGPRDPASLISSAIVLAAIGALAGWVPAYRASRVDPAEVLREP